MRGSRRATRRFHGVSALPTRWWSPVALALALVLAACGDPVATDSPPEAKPPEDPLLHDIVTVAAGESHTCAVNSLGRGFCWGDNLTGQLGLGAWSASPELRPSPTAQGTESFASVSLGDDHTCALTPGKEIWCWGSDEHRQLGYMTNEPLESCGSVPCSTFPRPVIDGTRFRTFATGRGYTCAGSSLGTLYCWGDNHLGQGGSGGVSEKISYAWPVTGQHLFDFVVAGQSHACAVTLGGDTYCWGDNAHGQVAVAEPCAQFGSFCPTPRKTPGGPFVALAAGDAHTCALTQEGTAYCWGGGGSGAAGWMESEDRPMPTRVSTSLRFTRLTAGAGHTCALTAAGEAYCWGSDDRGQLGRGSADAGGSAVPVRVAGTTSLEDIAAGGDHTCALAVDGHVFCWGANDRGQLGDGTTQDRSAPVGVAGPG